jgi:hypothetical protein
MPGLEFRAGLVSTAQGNAWQCPDENKSRDRGFQQENVVDQ